jgi:DNA-3-methyladenine glycosylase I
MSFFVSRPVAFFQAEPCYQLTNPVPMGQAHVRRGDFPQNSSSEDSAKMVLPWALGPVERLRQEAGRLNRCAWAKSELGAVYHDQEWGVPIHDDRLLFEFLVLEGAQAGLSWETILRKRERYRSVFDGFDPARVARYGEEKLRELLEDPGIVRNRAKVSAAVENARRFLEVQEAFGTFEGYLWAFVGGEPKQNRWGSAEEVPARTSESDSLSKDLKARGFRFVGSTICYAFMQAVGLVNDHTVDCFRHQETQRLPRRLRSTDSRPAESR